MVILGGSPSSGIIHAVALFVGLSSIIAGVGAWGKDGHMAIAQLAANRLNPKAREVIKTYLAGKSLEQIAPLPDNYDHSSVGKWSIPLHYVNLPRTATEYEDKYCAPPGCVVSAVRDFYGALVAEGTSGAICRYGITDEPCPIEFLVHFVGDIHQPLHVSYAEDCGGNTAKVSWFGKPTNLHVLWDEDMLATYASRVDTLISDLQQIMDKEPRLIEKYASIRSPKQWANESFAYVQTHVYQYQSPDLGQEYYDANIPVIQQRLIAAAVRLAELFNSLF